MSRDSLTSRDARRVRGLFAAIAPRYDFLNHLLSLNVDRSWRRRAVRALRLEGNERVLDACTGTGDLAFAAARALDSGGCVVGVDFCPEMVHLAERKRRRRRERRVAFAVGDALELPFPDGAFDAAMVAFGIRNLSRVEAGLEEFLRVLKPGGRLAVLEFTTPRLPVLRRAFLFYFHRILPRIGARLSGHPRGAEAYLYLPRTVEEFPAPEGIVELLAKIGFVAPRHRLLTGGIACLYTAAVPLGRAVSVQASGRP